MMRITKISVLIGLLFLVLSACGNGASDDEKNAEQYLKQYGYQITSRQGQVEKYILEKSKLSASTENIPYQQSWGFNLLSLINILEKKLPFISLQ